MTYCFDINDHHKKYNNCDGSYLTVDLDHDVPAKYRVTFTCVEPNK